MMTNEDIWRIALQQSAYDSGCEPEDFLAEQNVVTISQKHPLARKYLKIHHLFRLRTFDNQNYSFSSSSV